MSQSDHGNSNSQRPKSKRPRNQQNARSGEGRPQRGGGRRNPSQNEREPRRGGQRRAAGNRPPKPSLEYVLIQEDLCLAAEITAHPGPMRWRVIPDVALLSPGLYLRYRGSLQLVTRDLAVPNAVLYAVWSDENLSYRFEDGWASPGLRAAFLVPTPFADEEGPPWIPIDAAIPDTIEAWDTGLLSSQLDPVHCATFHAQLSVDARDLWVAATSVKEDGDEEADAALQQTMEWLARHPESDHPAAVTARVMLVEQGHGLQRAGVAAMRADQERTRALLADVLSVLAPDVAPVLQAVQQLWTAEDDEQTEHFIALARALEPHVANDNSPLQQPRNLAVLTTWLTGIFGSRPDRERRRPARSLFAAFRLLRRTRGNVDAFEHPDIDLPTFPTSRALSDEITRELSYFPQRETDLERLVRAMAVGESTRDFGRVHLDHLRPFALSYRRVRGYPIAARTLLGRYDGIVTMWSFRGKELDRDGVPARALNANFIFETSTWASIRAYGRVLGAKTAISPVIAEAISARPERGAPHHPDVVRLHELAELEIADVAERLSRATRARRPNQQRVSDAIAAHEFLIARLVRDRDALPDWTPIEPEWNDDEDAAVRRHFMYWRTYCRSFLPAATDSYSTFIERVVPSLATLPWKIENEALALVRTWSRQVEPAQVLPYQDALQERLAAILDESEHAARDERVLNILSVLAGCSFESWAKGVERLLAHPSWEQAEWNRILDGVREAEVRDALRTSDLFVRLAEAFASEQSVGVAAGRVEWLRQLLARGRRSQHIRWLLQRDAWPEVVYAPAFEAWFKDRATSAIEEPDQAIQELLQIAARQMSAETIDIPMVYLLQLEGVDARAEIETLLENQRGLALSAWLSNRSDLEKSVVDRALSIGVEQAKSIAELRILARLVYAAESQGVNIDAATRDALSTRVSEHVLPPNDYVAFDHQLDAWRLLDLPLDTEPAAVLSARVARAIANAKGPSPARDFAYWAADRALVREIGDDLNAAIGESSTITLFQGALEDFAWPEAIARMLRVAARSKRTSRQFRSVWGALRNADQSQVLEAWIDAWIVRRAKADPASTREELRAFDEALDALFDQFVAQNTSDDDADADHDDAQQNDDGADAQSHDDEAEHESSDDEAESDEQKTAAERLGDSLKERVRERALARIRTAVRFWIEQLDSASDADIAALPQVVVNALGNPVRFRLALRDSVFPRVQEYAQDRGLKVQDPRNVVANPMIPFDIALAPNALNVALATAMDFFAQEDSVKDVKLTRDGLQLIWTAPSTDAAESTDDAATSEDASDDALIESNALSNEDADGASDAETEEADAQDDHADDSTEDEASSDDDTTQLSERVRAWRNKDTQTLAVACVKRVLDRDQIVQLSVRQTPKGEEVSVRWRRPPRRHPRSKR